MSCDRPNLFDKISAHVAHRAAPCGSPFFSESDLLHTFYPKTRPRSLWKRTRLRPRLPGSPLPLQPAGPSPGLPRRWRFSRPKGIRTLRSSMRKRPTPPPPWPKPGPHTSPGFRGPYEPPSMFPIAMVGPPVSSSFTRPPRMSAPWWSLSPAAPAKPGVSSFWMVRNPLLRNAAHKSGLIVGSLRPGGYQRESFAGRKPLPLTPERIEALRSFVEASMKKFDVPGAGFALIDQGKVVYEGGIGVKATRQARPGRRPHALYGRVQHQGHDDAAARQTRR